MIAEVDKEKHFLYAPVLQNIIGKFSKNYCDKEPLDEYLSAEDPFSHKDENQLNILFWLAEEWDTVDFEIVEGLVK